MGTQSPALVAAQLWIAVLLNTIGDRVALGGQKLESGLEGRGDIVFFCDFESHDWYRQWGRDRTDVRGETLVADVARKFEPLQGKALRIKVERGGHYGTSLEFRF